MKIRQTSSGENPFPRPTTTDGVHYYCQPVCEYCGGGHYITRCIEYHKNGRVKRVEFVSKAGLPDYLTPETFNYTVTVRGNDELIVTDVEEKDETD